MLDAADSMLDQPIQEADETVPDSAQEPHELDHGQHQAQDEHDDIDELAHDGEEADPNQESFPAHLDDFLHQHHQHLTELFKEGQAFGLTHQADCANACDFAQTHIEKQAVELDSLKRKRVDIQGLFGAFVKSLKRAWKGSSAASDGAE
jgi:hypothetical protein